MTMTDTLRLATESDASALDALIVRSARILQAGEYSAELLDVAIGTALALDRQLIADRTFFLVERDGRPVACGGWSFRTRAHGADGHLPGANIPIRPGIDPARFRAFFVDPDCARQGLGSRILHASETAAFAAGFPDGVLTATLTGVHLYARHGWQEVARQNETLAGGIQLPVVKMTKRLQSPDGER